MIQGKKIEILSAALFCTNSIFLQIRWRRSSPGPNVTSKDKKVMPRSVLVTQMRRSQSAKAMTFPQAEIEEPSKDSPREIAHHAGMP